MVYTLIVKDEAIDDAHAAWSYYEEKQVGLGDRFLTVLDLKYKQLTQNPKHNSYISADKEKTMRDVQLKGFPFVVIYDIEGSEVIVYSVKNTYKKPAII